MRLILMLLMLFIGLIGRFFEIFIHFWIAYDVSEARCSCHCRSSLRAVWTPFHLLRIPNVPLTAPVNK
jgi:hypothetical protein